MMLLLDNIKSNPADWIMAIISLISAIVSVIACILSHQALHQSKKQYEDSQKIAIKPEIQVKEIPYASKLNGMDCVAVYESHPIHIEPLKVDICFQVTNVGKDTAKNISYRWTHTEKQSLPHISSLPVNDKRVICIRFEANPYARNLIAPSIIIRFADTADRPYEQQVYFILDIQKDKISLLNISTEAPKEK